MMTLRSVEFDRAVLEWAMFGSTKQERVDIIRDLLFHANEDEMSVEDRGVCVHAIGLLGGDPTPKRMKARDIMPKEKKWHSCVRCGGRCTCKDVDCDHCVGVCKDVGGPPVKWWM